MFHNFLGYINVNKQQKERKRAVWFCTSLSDLSVKLDCCVDSILARGFFLGSLKHCVAWSQLMLWAPCFSQKKLTWSWYFKIRRKLQEPVWFLIFETVLILHPTINTLWRSFWEKKPFPPPLSLRKELSLRALLWRHIRKHGAEIHCRLAWDKDLKSGSDQSLWRHYIFSSTSPHLTN